MTSYYQDPGLHSQSLAQEVSLSPCVLAVECDSPSLGFAVVQPCDVSAQDLTVAHPYTITPHTFIVSQEYKNAGLEVDTEPSPEPVVIQKYNDSSQDVQTYYMRQAPSSQGAPYYYYQRRAHRMIGFGALASVLFFPLGIVGLIFAIKALYARYEYEAQRLLKISLALNVTTAILSFIFYFLCASGLCEVMASYAMAG